MSLILVTGGRRTGTTLLTAILCSGEQSNPVIGETPLIRKLMSVLQWAQLPDSMATSDKYAFEDAADLLHFFNGIVGAYVERLRARLGNPAHIVLKSPEFCLAIEQLMAAVPKARFAVAVRDPRDQIVSELELRRRGDDGRTVLSALPLADIPYLVTTLNRYLEPVIAAARRAPERFLFVRFEDMLTAFPQTLDKLEAFTGMTHLRFDPEKDWPRYAAVEDFIPNYPSFSPYYGKPLELSRIGRYRDALDARSVRLIETGCSGLMDQFGYARAQMAGGSTPQEQAPSPSNAANLKTEYAEIIARMNDLSQSPEAIALLNRQRAALHKRLKLIGKTAG